MEQTIFMQKQIEQVLAKLIDTLRSKKYSVGFAESCTGGLLSAHLAAVPGVSDFFRGSIVAYANEVKSNLLGVPQALLQTEGAVSEAVAMAMAKGAARVLGVQCAAAVTGVAGPSGGTKEKPVGTVCFGICGPGFEKTDRKIFSGSRHEVQTQAAHFALELLVNELKK